MNSGAKGPSPKPVASLGLKRAMLAVGCWWSSAALLCREGLALERQPGLLNSGVARLRASNLASAAGQLQPAVADAFRWGSV